MPDNTLGGYTRHEKHDAADFARAEFARHKSGAIAVRGESPLSGRHWSTAAWVEYTDDQMAQDGGWSPVRECPDPERHNPAHDIDWQEVAELHEDTIKALVAELERHRAMAALWKETARHINRDARETITGILVRQMEENRRIHGARREAIARAEKAEQERDEALAGVRVLARENIECHERVAASCGHPNHGNQDQDCAPFLPAAESRPLTPDAISAEARDRSYRAVAALSTCDWDDMSGVAKGRAMALVEAVITEITRPEPPARPEGAEEIERLLMDADRDGGEVYRTDGYTRLADYLAEGLSKGGVRFVSEEGGDR